MRGRKIIHFECLILDFVILWKFIEIFFLLIAELENLLLQLFGLLTDCDSIILFHLSWFESKNWRKNFPPSFFSAGKNSLIYLLEGSAWDESFPGKSDWILTGSSRGLWEFNHVNGEKYAKIWPKTAFLNIPATSVGHFLNLHEISKYFFLLFPADIPS